MPETLAYADRHTERPKSPWPRQAALVLGAAPLVAGVGATVIHLLTGGTSAAIIVAFLALLVSFLAVPLGIVLLVVHLYRGAPERDRQHRARRTLIAFLVVAAVWPAAFVCIRLNNLLVMNPHLKVVNASPSPINVDIPVGDADDGILGTRSRTLAPGETYTTTIGGAPSAVVAFTPSPAPTTSPTGTPPQPSISIPSRPRGRLAPLRGYRVEWDGTRWKQTR